MDFTKRYDLAESKHFLEEQHFVLHCHHYNSLLHRAITRTPFFDGKAFLYEHLSSTFVSVLKRICSNHGLSDASDILKMAAEFYGYIGFGTLDFSKLSADGGTVVCPASHLGMGYAKKWGPQEEPVDDYACGYIGAAWAVAYGKSADKCCVKQTCCQAMGHSRAEFEVSVKN